jgi:hypothetical protein
MAKTKGDAVFGKVISDIEGMDLQADVKKKVLQLIRDAMQVEGVSLAKEGQSESECWKGIFLRANKKATGKAGDKKESDKAKEPEKKA